MVEIDFSTPSVTVQIALFGPSVAAVSHALDVERARPASQGQLTCAAPGGWADADNPTHRDCFGCFHLVDPDARDRKGYAVYLDIGERLPAADGCVLTAEQRDDAERSFKASGLLLSEIPVEVVKQAADPSQFDGLETALREIVLHCIHKLNKKYCSCALFGELGFEGVVKSRIESVRVSARVDGCATTPPIRRRPLPMLGRLAPSIPNT